MLPTVCFVQGLIELLGPLGFASGYFWDIEWLMIGCGILAVVDDAVEIGQGILNPVFPVVAAILLGLIFVPWYVGVFWASAGVKILGVPNSVQKIVAPRSYVDRAASRPDSISDQGQ